MSNDEDLIDYDETEEQTEIATEKESKEYVIIKLPFLFHEKMFICEIIISIPIAMY
jgi:hypothetical protein